ncbi:MAG: tetratricopeptide repeat protein [Lentimonas sp.]
MSDSIFQHPFTLKARRASVATLVLLLLGIAMQPVESLAWREVKAGQSELNLEELEGALGQGLVVGVLGGFRTIIADFVWIRMTSDWRKKDRAKVDAMIRLATTLDPRPEFFWRNSARIIAYDMPNWRIQEEGGYDAVPDEREYQLNLEQAGIAFKLLERAREFHPDDPRLYLETAQIYMNRLKDFVNAAKWFLRASEIPSAPYYAARMYAQLLREQGRDAEAYEFLKELYVSLPDDPRAQKGVVLERIRVLEDALRTPLLFRFQAEALGPVTLPGESLMELE